MHHAASVTESAALMALSRYRDALVQHVGPERPLVYQPLVPQILTACYQVVLLPPRDFGAWPPVARDVYYAVALFLHLRTAYPDLIQKHRGAGSLLLTPRLGTQATFAKLFADIGVDGDIRYARVDELLKHGPPAPASITARHAQALRTDLRAETLSHAAGLTSHTTVLVFGKSGFIGQDEAGHGRSTVGLTRARVYAYYFAVHTSDWQLPEAPLPLTLGPQDLSAVLRPLEATSWADVPLALQIQNPEGRTVLLRLTLKRRKLPHPSFDPMSELPIYPRVTGSEANNCFWGYCGSRTNRTFAWYGTNQHGAFIRICNTTPKIRLRLPHTGSEEVLQDGYRLVLLPKLAFYALWDGHGESFVVPRATTGVAEVALLIGSYASAPVDNLDPQDSGTDITGLPPTTVTDPSCRPAPSPAPEERVELQRGDWQPSLAWQSADVRDTAHAAQEAATSSARLLSSPSSTSSSSTTPSPGTPVPAHANDATDKAALAARPRVSMDAPGRPGDATPNPAQTNAMAASAASDAMSSIPPDATLPPVMPLRPRTPR